MLELLLLVVVGLVVAAYFVTDDKFGITSPALVVRQVFHWVSFGLLATKDAALLVKDATVNANTTAELSIKQSGAQVDLGLKQGADQYKASDIRKNLVSARKEVRDDTASKKALIQKLAEEALSKAMASNN